MSEKKFSFDESLLPVNMLALYSIGAFPMAKDKISSEFDWYLPPIRAIIPLNKFNIPRSLKKILSQNNYEIKFDNSASEVIHHCQNRDESWISPKLIQAYERLFKIKKLHTVEVHIDGKLAGGLFGIATHGVFFGESMFSLQPHASKIALAHLLWRLKEKKYLLLDIQYISEHLKMFGAIEISFDKYNILLKEALARRCGF